MLINFSPRPPRLERGVSRLNMRALVRDVNNFSEVLACFPFPALRISHFAEKPSYPIYPMGDSSSFSTDYAHLAPRLLTRGDGCERLAGRTRIVIKSWGLKVYICASSDLGPTLRLQLVDSEDCQPSHPNLKAGSPAGNLSNLKFFPQLLRTASSATFLFPLRERVRFQQKDNNVPQRTWRETCLFTGEGCGQPDGTRLDYRRPCSYEAARD